MARRCDGCGETMHEGFCIHDGDQYFCSDECLHKVYTQEEYEEMYEEDEAYWTEWYDEEDEEDEEEEEPKGPEMLRVCYKAPGKPVEVREIPHELKEMQALVGGYIEVGGALSREVAIICNEEGRLMGLPYNCLGLVGPIFFVGRDQIDFRSLTDKEIEAIMACNYS